MKRRKFKGVLFDFDGVVTDSMSDNFQAWKKAFEVIGVNIKEDDYYPLEGYSTLDVAKITLEKYKKDENPKKISNLKHHYYLKSNRFKLYEGIENIINLFFRKNIGIALVTGANRSRVEWSLKSLKEKFKVIVAGDDKIRGKPAPDPYLLAANKLGIPPNQCIVVENAPIGIKSAKTAGCYCIALMTTLGREPLEEAGADKVFESHKDLLKYFRNNL